MKYQRGFTLIELMIYCIGILFWLAVVGGIIYTAIHFISKFW